MKRICFMILLALGLILVSSGQQSEQQPEHTHNWEPANCTRGELCWSCGETRGEALGHNWVNATCDRARHCTHCGREEGDPLSHTPDGSGSCAVCKAELDPRVVLDGVSPGVEYHVYGGVILSFWMNIRDSDKSGTGKFGKEYRIYDEAGTLVTQGEWVQKFYNHTKTDTGVRSTYYHDTDYIPLSPGLYRVEYSYYTTHKGGDNGNRPVYGWECYRTGDGRLLSSSNMLMVH